MKIIEKIRQKSENIYGCPPVTLAFLGDSVTQGCFQDFVCDRETNRLQTVFESRKAYSTRLSEIMHMLFPNVQINIINSGISGDSAEGGLKRIERDILPYNPDLVVVSYGLNDACSTDVESFGKRLAAIFDKLKKTGAEIIYLTENPLCSKVSPHITEPCMRELAARLCEIQNSGALAEFYEKGRQLAAAAGVKVCDTNKAWKSMISGGVDTTELLVNKLNHPIEEWHYYIAIKLIETMFEI